MSFYRLFLAANIVNKRLNCKEISEKVCQKFGRYGFLVYLCSG